MKVLSRIAVCAALSLASLAHAQGSKTVNLVVPYPPGGAVDQLARVLAQQMNDKQGYKVIVDNRPGAGAQVAMNTVKLSNSTDPVLFLADSGAFSLNRHLYSKLNYDVKTDLVPISLVAKAPVFLLVADKSPIKSVEDLVNTAKTTEQTYGSPGVGTGTHIVAEMLAKETGAKLSHVPYRGAGPALIDLVGGQIDFMFDVLIGSKGFLNEGRLRAIAAATPERTPLRPNVPTIAESGIKNVNFTIWWGIAAKAGTPKDVADRLQKDIVTAMSDKTVRKQFAEMGVEIETSSPEQFAALIEKDANTYGPVIKALDIKLD